MVGQLLIAVFCDNEAVADLRPERFRFGDGAVYSQHHAGLQARLVAKHQLRLFQKLLYM